MGSGLAPRGCWSTEREPWQPAREGMIIIIIVPRAFSHFKEFSTSLCKSNLQNFYFENYSSMLPPIFLSYRGKQGYLFFLQNILPSYIQHERLLSIPHCYESPFRERNPYPASNKHKGRGRGKIK